MSSTDQTRWKAFVLQPMIYSEMLHSDAAAVFSLSCYGRAFGGGVRLC